MALLEGWLEMSFMLPAGPGRLYGWWRRAVLQIAGAALCSVALTVATAARAQAPVKQAPVMIVALGASLTAGYGLPDNEGFVPRLQAALAAEGIAAQLQN